MKRITLSICTAAILLFACNNEKTANETSMDNSATAADSVESKEKGQAWIPIDSATGMKAMIEYGTPGEPHKMLAKSNGTWVGEMTMWMADGAPPSKSTTTTVNTMIFGGRYQQSKHTGNFEGMPFEGVSIMGYDNAKKEYISTWVDNMSTGILNTSGTWDEASKTVTLTGKQKNPANGLDCNLKETFKMIDDNNQVMEMYGPDPTTGKEYKMMEIKYTRKK